MVDTKKAGFLLEPRNEDDMDKWLIKMFGFDENSNMVKHLMVLGMESVELETLFSDQYPFEPLFVCVIRHASRSKLDV